MGAVARLRRSTSRSSRRPRSTSSTRRSGGRDCTASSRSCSARLLDCADAARSSRTSTGWTTRPPSCSATSGPSSTTSPGSTCTLAGPARTGSSRPRAMPPLPALTLRLEPLPPEDAKTLVQAAAGERSLSDEELEAIVERGGGNPLFLQELASAGRGDGRGSSCPRRSRRWSRRGSTGSRRATARCCAGPRCSASPSRARSSPTCSRATRTSRRRRRPGTGSAEFVERDPDAPGAFRFRHALIRDAAYEGLPFKRRRELHGRVAEVMERRATREGCELLSLHFYRAERWSEAWRYSVVAGRRAHAKCANVEAEQFFQRALEAAREGGNVEQKRSRRLGGAGRLPAARRALRRERGRVRVRPAAPRGWIAFAHQAAGQRGPASRGDGRVRGGDPLVPPRAQCRGATPRRRGAQTRFSSS